MTGDPTEGPVPSSSGSASVADDKSKPKPTDISHLIKRKKPDVASPETEGSPAKKPALEQSQ